MKIIIAGAGEVGFHVAQMLSSEEHDIVLIDKDSERLNQAESQIDIGVMKGNAVSISVLEKSGINGADLLIAATSVEDTNLTTAILGKKLGAKRTIARISNPEFQRENGRLDMRELGIDAMVFPEELAAKEIYRLIKLSAATDSFVFGEGKLYLTGLVLDQEAPLVNKSLIEAVQLMPDVHFTVVAIQRGEKTIVPRGDTRFRPNDHVYFISKPDCVHQITRLSGKAGIEVNNLMILGGSLIARIFAKNLGKKYNIKLIEKDREKCFELASELTDVMVLHGDGSNVALLEDEGIENMDAFVALTGDSETNIISCLVAKSRGVKRTIALVENMAYISLSQSIGIDTLINKKMIAINNIFRYVRAGNVEALTSLHGVESEVLEFVVNEHCKITEAPIKKLKFPREAVIAGIIRGEESFTASGETHIQAGDRVVVFTLPSAISKVESYFQ
ncbi:MAG: Trk system potassium transporter TrkA [Bacteroidetes bacterium]|nr:MAG: Trk system potassium transporter TrkA [Bacteroidota bacterium]